MKLRHVLGVGLAASMLMIASSANALDESTHGPMYLQSTLPLGLHYGISLDPGSDFAGWRPDIEFGYHFSGRADGFVLAFRQAFIVMAAPRVGAGTTQLKYGYDIPLHFGDNFELIIAPYGTFGIGYTFASADLLGPNAGINMTWGADGKFFLVSGLYAFVKPFEMGFQCLHDYGKCGITMVWGGGMGFAFPSL